MQNTNNQIITYICKKKKGRIFFSDEFRKFGSGDAIRQSLSRLCKNGFLIRLSAGIYLYPRIDKNYGIIYPSIEEIAKIISKRENKYCIFNLPNIVRQKK